MKPILTAAALLGSSLLVVGCATAPSVTTQPLATTWPVQVPEADPALAPVSFLAGSWFSVNPGGSVNREHWTKPRGKVMTGTFQQIHRTGRSILYELSAIEVLEGKVVLHLRHYHQALGTDHEREKTELYFLAESGPNRVVFKPSDDPTVPREKGVASIGYSLNASGQLVQEIKYIPGSPEKDYTGVSSREPTR
jgi:hypothetical protein